MYPFFGHPQQFPVYGGQPYFYGGDGGFGSHGFHGGIGGSAYAPSAWAARPYDRSSSDYNNIVLNQSISDSQFGGTPESVYREYHALAKQETDPVYRALLRAESDKAYNQWKGNINQGHYNYTMNCFDDAGKAFANGW